MNSPFSLSSKIILITGASSGIGRAVAVACAQAGACCIISARNENRLCETLSLMPHGNHSLLPADLTSGDEITEMVKSLPRLDGVVCCAGVVETKILKFTEDQDIQNLFSTNTFSVIRLVRSLMRQKKMEKEGSVVVVSSISGVRCGYVGGAVYGASKGALEGFVKATALELAPQKIRVNTIMPGMVETSLLNGSDIDQVLMDEDKKRYPLKRYGKPEEIGYAAVYLLSDATLWMTGTSLLIDVATHYVDKS